MSDEITISVSGTLNNATGTGSSKLQRSYSPGAAKIDQATKRRGGQSQPLTSAWEVIDYGDVTAGYAFLQNTDATFNVDLATLEAGSGGSTVLFATMLPGDPPNVVSVPSGVTHYARASGGSGATATLDVEIWSQ